MIWSMIVHVCITIIIWSGLFQSTTTGLVTFHVNNNSNNSSSSSQSYVYHTQDPFEVRVEPYLINGWLMPMKFDTNNKCKLLGNNTHLTTLISSLSNTTTNSSSSTDVSLINSQHTGNTTSDNRQIIAAIDAHDALTHGCLTVAHAGLAASDLAASLHVTYNLSLQAVLYLIQHNNHNNTSGGGASVPGAPHETYYYSRAMIFPYGRPAVTMAIMPIYHYQEVLARSNQMNDTVIAVTLQQAWPWNDAFLSGYYIAVVYALALIDILFILYNSTSFIFTLRTGRQCPSRRIVMFAMAMVITLLHTVVLFSHTTTPLYVCLQRLLALLRNIAIQVLLLLWHSILAGIQDSKQLRIVKVLIWFNFTVVNIWLISFTIITVISNSRKTRGVMAQAIFAMGSLQIITILLVVYYGLKFWRKRNTLNISRETRNALGWISKQCAILFLCSIIMFIASILNPLAIWRYGVAAEVSRILLEYVGCVLFNAVLSLVLTSTTRDSQQHGSHLFSMLSRIICDKATQLIASIRFSDKREASPMEQSSITMTDTSRHHHYYDKASQPVRSSIQLDETKVYESTTLDRSIIYTLNDSTI
ncbi:hypothetical protein BDF22DRAFT_667364 [Syncephalis plumigaleata]|nr:hypothetical protein BDF22DRAFT_667364 [Syncephalis plumigaleata]